MSDNKQEDNEATRARNAVINILNEMFNRDAAKIGTSSEYAIGHHTDGNMKIMLPKDMDGDQAIKTIYQISQTDEMIVGFQHQIPGHPVDAARALKLAIKEIYGYAELVNTPPRHFFDSEHPPELVDLATGVGTSEQIPWGRMVLNGLEGGYLETSFGGSTTPKLVITGKVKRKLLPFILKLVQMTTDLLKEKSVYRGKAIKVDLSAQAGEESFDFNKHVPTFMDLSGVSIDDLIVNQSVQTALESSVYVRVMKSEACLVNNVPLKNGLILAGRYGVGKSLTARVVAKICQDNGWTFIYVKNAKHLAQAIEFAKLYLPAIIFVEDIDLALEGQERTEDINEILNMMDGIDTKDLPIITIATTNRPEVITKASLRAGRMDHYVEMTNPDAATAIKMVRKILGDLLAPNQDLEPVGKAMDGFVPAFIEDACHIATSLRIYRTNGSVLGTVTSYDLIKAAESLNAQIALIEGRKPEVVLHPAVSAHEKMVKDVAEELGTKLKEGDVGTAVDKINRAF